MRKKAIVIGTGIAGLSSILRLLQKGYQVKAFETNDYVGGKITSFQSKGYRWDMGPSLFTMPQYVNELFELFGENPKDHFNYNKKEVLCNYFWEDGTTFSAKSDPSLFVKEVSQVFKIDPVIITDYLKKSKLKYDLTAPIFLEKSLHRWATYFSFSTIKALFNLAHLNLFDSLDQLNKRKLKHKKLIQFFNRFATYNGSSPYKTPGIMSMIPHLEMGLGTYFPHGGMHEISQSLYRLCQSKGAEFQLSNAVTEILHDGSKITGVVAGAQICNMDIYATYQRLLKDVIKPKKTLAQERSSSALIFYWGIKKTFKQLDLHNILFSESYEEEFKHIFERKTLIDDPTIYINISSKEEKKDAPEGCENWFVMINCPGNFNQDWDQIKRDARSNIIKKINRTLNVEIEDYIEGEEILDPLKIESKTSSHQGALYGASSNNQFAAFLRHPNFSNELKNLYFCGGSVHPGGGIPLSLLSAKIVSEQITSLK
jgi:phytoene desaturase